MKEQETYTVEAWTQVSYRVEIKASSPEEARAKAKSFLNDDPSFSPKSTAQISVIETQHSGARVSAIDSKS